MGVFYWNAMTAIGSFVNAGGGSPLGPDFVVERATGDIFVDRDGDAMVFR